MKKKFFLTSLLVVVLMLLSAVVYTGCNCETPAPEASSSSLIPTQDGVFDLGRSNKQWDKLYLGGSLYTNNGTATVTLPTANGTLVTTAGTQTLTNKTLASPTITGTPVVANHASGTSGNLSSGSVVVTHGMSGTPTLIQLTYAADPGNSTSTHLWPSSINGTAFTVNSGNSSVACRVNWYAEIASE